MNKMEFLEKYSMIEQTVPIKLASHAKLNMRIFIYECIHLIYGQTFPQKYTKAALNVVTLKEKYKFQIIVDTLDLLISEAESLTDVKRITNNALSLLRGLQDEMYQECYVDSLTKVWNYNYLKKLEHEISDKDFTLFFFDLDNLKQVNDSHGHEQGNKIIKEFASVLKDSFRAGDIIIRYGGDEFLAIAFRNQRQPQQFIKKIENHKLIQNNQIKFSTGFADNKNKNLQETIYTADKSMYLEKVKK